MGLNSKYSDEAVNAAADAIAAKLTNGYLRIYDGAQPAAADHGIGGARLLAELRLGNPAFAAASAGVIVARAITDDSQANATGTATWYRCLKSDGMSSIHDGSVGRNGCNLNLNSVAIQVNVVVSVTAFQITVPKR